MTQSKTFSEPLSLACGQQLPEYTIAFETYGKLSGKRDNAILVCHPLTKHIRLMGQPTASNPRAGWWNAAVGPGRMIDTEKYYVICSNVIGGSDGSTGPASINPDTGQPYAISFPVLTVTDMVYAQKRLMEQLGIDRLFSIVGGCFGGQQALEWVIQYPEAVQNAVVFSTTPWTSAHTIAIFNVMRRLICADPNWKKGNYYGSAFPQQGLAHAVVAAVPLWMSREAMAKKFGRSRQRNADYTYSFEPEFAVETYLDGVANRVGQHIDPNSLLYLTRAMEYFDLSQEYGSLEQAFSPIQARILLISYRSDWRYPSTEMQRMQLILEDLGVDARHVILDNPLGHSAFVYDVADCAEAVATFLAESPAASQLINS